MDRDELEKLIAEGLSSRDIAKRLGLSQATVSRYTKKFGLVPNGYKSKTYSNRFTYCDTCGKKITRGYKKCLSCYPRKRMPIDQLKNPAKVIRKLLLDKRGHKCENCGISLWQDYPITLELHHKDGNSKNNDDSNVQLLCPNCHSQSWDYRFTMNKVSSRREDRYGTERSLSGREA